jgi:hypothetical protein
MKRFGSVQSANSRKWQRRVKSEDLFMTPLGFHENLYVPIAHQDVQEKH